MSIQTKYVTTIEPDVSVITAEAVRFTDSDRDDRLMKKRLFTRSRSLPHSQRQRSPASFG